MPAEQRALQVVRVFTLFDTVAVAGHDILDSLPGRVIDDRVGLALDEKIQGVVVWARLVVGGRRR